jgi:hypothetical protein
MTGHVTVYMRSDQNPDGQITYKTNAGIPFECVEFVRRYFMQTRGLTFPSVVDATDMFYRIRELVPLKPGPSAQLLQSFVYPYVKPALHYLRPGTMLFWVPNPALKYGHVAIVVDSDAEHVVVAQQNKSPPIQVHKTRQLFNDINAPNSAYLGVKLVAQGGSD